MLPYNKEFKSRAQELRKNATPQESRLWFGFLRKHSISFTRQKPIGSYIVDFLCPSKKLVIEIDGSQHFSDDGIEHDKERTAYLESLGLQVIRFTNTEINNSFDSVCLAIQTALGLGDSK